ncbi:type II secretion system protein J [Variovorax sp. OV329]|uniref:PulJ/GspJ family protein n=1 Tax=Variovorax sp. OV329 TaxID=1882825 RepID=UPI0008EF98A2|nr:prepilin-type N-terminal cleavage/methylation domain-containing protein [Variovorax sp. OV329]SFM16919.1 general secretion pathway protein J [Variovorax sp. OV329]
MRSARHAQAASRGFTLIELLVAIAILAVLAVVSWRGIDGMARAQEQMRDRADAVLTLQSALAQWNSDLDNAVSMQPTRAIDWTGRSLRLTRKSTAGDLPSITVVAWTLRTGADGVIRWYRWQSPPLFLRSDWQQAWQQAAAWAGDGGGGSSAPGGASQAGSEVVLMPVTNWQLLYFRNDLWTPAVPAEALGANESLPAGVRLLLDLAPGPALSGTLSIDWVRPTLTQAKS